MSTFKPVFLDFEASSLDSGSFPIEIGWVFENGQGESYLIRPQSNWVGWSPASERIHGISRETLIAEGEDATKVARRTAEALRGYTLYSDNAEFESYWLTMLYETAGLPVPPVHRLDTLIREQMHRILTLNTKPPQTPHWHRQHKLLLDEAEMLIAHAKDDALLEMKTVHRALPDAQNMWRLFKAAQRAMDRRLSP